MHIDNVIFLILSKNAYTKFSAEPTDADMSIILRELTEYHKFLLFLSALLQYSSVKIAAIRGQTDRNIRKVRNTMLKRIRKKLLEALNKKVQTQQPLTLLEKNF